MAIASDSLADARCGTFLYDPFPTQLNALDRRITRRRERIGVDWLTFIAEMTKALAWPIAAVFVFLAFRNQLAQRFSALESLKWNNFEFRFAREVHRVAAEAQAAVPQPEVRA